MSNQDLLDRVCRGVASIQEGHELRVHVEQLQETVQRYVEHHEHCKITSYHGVREKSELSRLREHLRQKSAQVARLQEAVQRFQQGTAEKAPGVTP